METNLLQTVVVLAACVVFLAKQSIDVYKNYGVRRKNGGAGRPGESTMIADLYKWHKPVIDPGTGQPRFMWYLDSKELQKELQRNRETMEELRGAILKMNQSIERLASEFGDHAN